MAAVHKAGEERRLGATPATTTLLTSSWKARDPVRPSKARPFRVRARRKTTGGPRQSPRSVCLPTARSSNSCLSGRAERPRVYAVAEPAATPEDRQSERSEVCRDRAREKYKMPEGLAGRRAAVVRRVRRQEGVILTNPVPGASKRS